MKCISKGFLIKLGLIFFGLPVCHFQNSAQSQELQLVHEWKVQEVVDATSDYSGNLYVSNEQGIISKYDKNGQLLLSYSGSVISPIYSIDVSHTTKIFGFYRENQSYLILDRFLNPLHEAILNNSIAGYATETAYAADNNLWIFDQSDLSIKKINLLNNALITVISISLVIGEDDWNIQQIEEYQNRLYLFNASKDVYIFDNLGNYIKKPGIKPECNFWFNGEFLVYIEQAAIYKFNLYNNDVEQIGHIGNTSNILKVISNDNFIYLISKNKIIVYRK
jgi:hypothetical protein